MSGNALEWIGVALFFACFVVLTIGEVLWLIWRKWTRFWIAAAFSFGTNLFGFCIGLAISFVILTVILAMAWDGSIDKIPARDTTLWIAMAAATLITPVLLILSKRLLLWLLKIQTGLTAWIFAFLASILVFILTMGLPALFLYFV